jgi:hypothetical protein
MNFVVKQQSVGKVPIRTSDYYSLIREIRLLTIFPESAANYRFVQSSLADLRLCYVTDLDMHLQISRLSQLLLASAYGVLG